MTVADPIAPIEAVFQDDEELRRWLGLPDTEEGRRTVAAIRTEERISYLGLRTLERELLAGRIPKGAIVCTRGRR